MNNGIKIIKAEGKDLIGGKYTIKANNYKRYKASFDYSLIGLELEDEGAEFFEVNGKQYTNDIICVSFKYYYDISKENKLNVKEFNKRIANYNKVEIKYNKNKIRKANSELRNELLSDIYDDLKIKAVRNYINNKNKVEVKNKSLEIKNKNKAFQRKLISKYIKSTSTIRKDLYKNGFDILFAGNKVHYVRFLRSSGSSRVGKCLFIKEELHNKIMEWSYMGLNIDEMSETDLASLESYLALPVSSIIDTMEGIKAENILFINEVKSTFKEKAMCTEIVKENGKDILHTEPKEMTIKNSIHDGQALMDTSLFAGDYKNKGMLLLRNRFFKGACFNTNIQKWFDDNNITEISQLNGYTRAKKISDVKLILNDTCVKFVKFGTREEWLDKLEDKWGIVKYEKPTHYFKGNLVSTHYQLLNTLSFNRSEMVELLQPTMEYFDLMMNDTRVMRNFIGAKVDDIEDLKDSNMMISALLGINNQFAETKLYAKFRDDKRKAFIKDLQKGHMLVNGTYAVLFGNGIEMLKESIGKYTGKSILNKGEVYCTAFANNIELLGCRSPHVTMGNLALMKNVRINAIDKYFNLSKNIICINSIEENSLERLSSADFDSDQLLLTDNKLTIDKLKLHYDGFLVPTSNVQADKVRRLNNADQKADLDIKTSVNKIGEIINLSQQLNTLLWDKYNRTKEFDMDIYVDACQLDVMSCIEIDSAKKEYTINNTKELDKLRKKYKIDSYIEDKTQIKPYFMQFTGRLKDEEKEEQFENIEFKKFETSMDYLEDIIEHEFKKIKAKKVSKYKTIKDIIINTTKSYKVKNANRHQIPKIVNIIKDNKNKIDSLYVQKPSKNLSNEEIKEWNTNRYNQIIEINEKMYKDIEELNIKIETIKKLFIETEDKYSDIARKTFAVMFATNRDKVLELIKDTTDTELTKYMMSKDADITLYGIGYKEVKCNI